MKKIFLGVFIVCDLVLMGAASFVLYTVLSHHGIPMAIPFSSTPSSAIKPVTAAAPSTTAVAASSAVAIAPAAPESGTQNRVFSYRNSHAKLVAIRADFTGWKAEPMQRDSAGVWTYKAVLSPGEYAYCYSVDDKPPLKDPVNKRTKVIGRAVVSAIVVEPTSPKPLK